RGITAVALASRFWGLGCPKIFHEVATRLIIPFEMPSEVEVEAAEVPVFKARLGVADGNYSLKVSEWLQKSKRKGLHEYLEMERKSIEEERKAGD
ncbi:MAG: FliM/FliN family flagellar motor C-terminal domain-containing protein, partial [Candidatus Thiodiazotropha sp. (ex Gloverina cf. vestifex)]|nr:FliM/FliN family flagellar motor C-terminal domain-containing protein [Candidatus Thiodiazotropha sp. (ex Gloverina cf. vestifex)]